ncbi:Holliday junction resolvase RecU [Spiroplasma chrysopicola]|uniref:Holliday junction resolvase RecU n=1 Tax=Spiroplasma chrysopicola DF-1 TaxID=1276227 RepID=R4UBM1_9MOLU|nr:Holliday junction resolvase RecU [Spiroplasma chrysopicola]AGM25304.1 Holliday junction-specific endonuclease [Spiroplasma chrysopicola DF-1]
MVIIDWKGSEIIHLTANRGMFLETLINYTINEYQSKNIALFNKRPVNIIPLVKNGAIIEKGYFKEKSTCDYYGLFRGTYVEFEAKETFKEKFNLALLKKHQLEQLFSVTDHGGISFIVVYFHLYHRFFLLYSEEIKKWLRTIKSRQMSITYFEQYGHELFITYPYILDFYQHLIIK